jgi:hypothetical protein
MTAYITTHRGTKEEEERRNRSKESLEIANGRMKPDCHSARFGHFALHRDNQPGCARTKAESARIVTL